MAPMRFLRCTQDRIQKRRHHNLNSSHLKMMMQADAVMRSESDSNERHER